MPLDLLSLCLFQPNVTFSSLRTFISKWGIFWAKIKSFLPPKVEHSSLAKWIFCFLVFFPFFGFKYSCPLGWLKQSTESLISNVRGVWTGRKWWNSEQVPVVKAKPSLRVDQIRSEPCQSGETQICGYCLVSCLS